MMMQITLSRQSGLRLKNNFLRNGSVPDTGRNGYQLSSPVLANVREVVAGIRQDPKISVRCLTGKVKTSKSLAHRILKKELKPKACKIPVVTPSS